MKSKLAFLIVFCLVFIISIPVAVSAKEITVDDNSEADFVSIQEAVNNSVPDDTIIVKPGTYTENVLVNVDGLTIRSELNNGNARIKPLIESESTFMITADNTTISGLNIIGPSQDYLRSAVFIYGDKSTIRGNTIENGCILQGPERGRNLITEIKISNGKGEEGIHISCCGGLDSNIVSNNTISNCSNGIYEYDQGAVIRNNRITDCDNGIELSQSSSGIDNNTISNCNVGIKIGESCHVSIINNKILTCANCGIFDTERDGNRRIYNNYLNNSLNVKFGLAEWRNTWSDWGYTWNRANTWNDSLTKGTNIVGGPNIGGNFWANPNGTGFSQISVDMDGNGIGDLPYNIYEDEYDYLPLVSGNSYLLLVDFTANVTSGYAPLTVQFNDSSEKVTKWNWEFGDGNNSSEQNPKHTYSAAGNFTVNLTVSNSNGTVSKTQKMIVKDPKDLPVANFSTNVTSGYVPLAVQFTDLSGNSIGRDWDFNNDWQSDSGDETLVYVFTKPGSYNVNLVAINENGTTSQTIKIIVLEENSSAGNSSDSLNSSGNGSADGGSSSSDSSSSSGGGSGGSGSPESQGNVAIKELSQTSIFTGTPVKFEFPQKVTAVESITFDSKKTVGKTTTIVEILKNQSALVSEPPSDQVYKFLNIWVGSSGFATPKNIENAVVNFKVEKSWIQDKNIDKSSITLNRYSDKKWNQLTTSLSGEDDNYLYFTAKTPGFSPFAITGKSKAGANGIKPSADKTQPAVNVIQNNTSTGSAVAHAEQTSVQTQNSNKSGKENKRMPGFVFAYCFICLLCIFLYRKMRY